MKVGNLEARHLHQQVTIRDLDNEGNTPRWVVRGLLMRVEHMIRRLYDGGTTPVTVLTLQVGPAQDEVTVELSPNQDVE